MGNKRQPTLQTLYLCFLDELRPHQNKWKVATSPTRQRLCQKMGSKWPAKKLKHVLTTKTGNITNQKGYAFNVLAIEEYVNVPSILVCLEMVYTVYLPNVYFHRGNDDKTMDFVVIILFSEWQSHIETGQWGPTKTLETQLMEASDRKLSSSSSSFSRPPEPSTMHQTCFCFRRCSFEGLEYLFSVQVSSGSKKMLEFSKHWEQNYPLVICYIAIENGHRNSWFTH